MRKKLKELRIGKGYETQQVFADKLGISLKTYNNIERGYSFPREHLLKQIMKELEIADLSVFDNVKEKSRGKASKKICEYMNMRNEDGKTYTIEMVRAIRKGLKLELEDRKAKSICIISNSEKGKWQIYERAAEEARKKFSCITAQDVHLFKECTRLESEIRTGKTTWGVPKERKRLGCNPVSGYIGRRLNPNRLKIERDRLKEAME